MKRPPKGFAADHPLIEDLKRKDFILSAALDQQSIAREDFDAQLAKIWQGASPMMRLLTEAVGLPF